MAKKTLRKGATAAGKRTSSIRMKAKGGGKKGAGKGGAKKATRGKATLKAKAKVGSRAAATRRKGASAGRIVITSAPNALIKRFNSVRRDRNMNSAQLLTSLLDGNAGGNQIGTENNLQA